MNVLDIFYQFPTEEKCVEHLESVRWGDDPCCPHCGSVNVARKQDGNRIGRWNCHGCNNSFNVLSGTFLCKTRMPLQKWFMMIGLMVNAKKSLSSHQIARDLNLTQPTALSMQHRIRAAMMDNTQKTILTGVVEVDETYVGGKPRKTNKRKPRTPRKRGRGTSKTAVIGAVERGGKVVAQVATDLSAKSIVRFLKNSVKPQGTLLITDEYPGYRNAHKVYTHSVVNHARNYVEGFVHTNSIESFWALVKRAWYGTHHHYSRELMPLFIAEQCWKYNHRDSKNAFGQFIKSAIR